MNDSMSNTVKHSSQTCRPRSNTHLTIYANLLDVNLQQACLELELKCWLRCRLLYCNNAGYPFPKMSPKVCGFRSISIHRPTVWIILVSLGLSYSWWNRHNGSQRWPFCYTERDDGTRLQKTARDSSTIYTEMYSKASPLYLVVLHECSNIAG